MTIVRDFFSTSKSFNRPSHQSVWNIHVPGTETAFAWCDSGALPRRTGRRARADARYFPHFGGGAVTAEVGNGGEGDGVAAARGHPPDGVPPCPAFCCPERPAGSTTSNAPAITTRITSYLHISTLGAQLHHIPSNTSNYSSPIDRLKTYGGGQKQTWPLTRSSATVESRTARHGGVFDRTIAKVEVDRV